MPALRSSLLAAISGIAIGLLIQPGASLAYTPEQQQACTPDAMRLCGEFVPNVDAITACMVQKRSQLSPQCAVYFRQGPAPADVATGQPVNIKPVTKKKTSSKPTTKKTTASKSKKPKREDS